MIKKTSLQSIAITALLLLLAVSSIAQESYLKNRWNIKLSGAPELTINNRRQNSFLLAEVNYGFFNHLEVGIGLGLENTLVAKLNPDATNTDFFSNYFVEDYTAPLYNLQLNYHLMPYLVKERKPRFDVYAKVHMGGTYIKSDNTDQNFFWNYYLGSGIAWYFNPYIGIYSEYGKAWPFKKDGPSKSGFRFGLTVKF